MSTEPAKTLAEALARIYADGGRYVQKTGQMQGSVRYSYAKEGDFIATIRPLMESHGVTIRPKAMTLAASEVIETQNRDGGTRRQNRVVILATFELLHTSGDKLDVQTFGEGIDSGDKAFNKAMTGAMKYALRQTFCVETGDDPDDTPSHEQERKPATKPAPPPLAKDKPDLRRTHEKAYAQCVHHADYLAVRKAVVADVEAKRLSPEDVDALRALDRETAKRCPAPQPAVTTSAAT